MRIVLEIQYDGTNYCGWQRQPNGVTIQQIIEEKIEEITHEKINLVASGRTDSGVHAIAQVAHFDTNSTLPAQSYAPVLNTLLPYDIKILESSVAKEDFHARYSAKRKTYVYKAYESRFLLPLKDRFATRINSGADLEKMQAAAKLIVGEHDFKCFCSSGSEVLETTRTIYTLTVEKNAEDWIITVCGNGFLYNMVRIIAGTLFGVGYGKVFLKDISNALEKGDRNLVGKTMPPNGLTLLKVEYQN